MRAVLLFLYAMMAALASADAAVAAAGARTAANSAPAPVGRIILKLRPSAAPLAANGAANGTSDAVIGALAARRGVALRGYRTLMPRLHVLSIDSLAPGDSLQSAIARLRADAAVEYAEPDQRRHPLAIPNDPLFAASADSSGEWYLQSPLATGAPSAIDAVDAWNTSTGSSGVVIADVDTGVRFDHPDLLRAGANGRLLPGYTFISDEAIANNFATWNADPSDPGDWIDQADQQNGQFSSCALAASSWHGTRVMGVLGALSDNGIGIAGVTWNGWVLPVRALGKCGGEDSDIETAMLWAAGLDVSDGDYTVPLNPYPARIINLSLGASGSCPQSYQDVIDTVSNLGVLVVVAAGNDGATVEAPANCNGVVAVAGLREAGTKVGYSDLGPQISVSAPAGNCGDISGECRYTIETTTNLGTTTPEASSYTSGIDYSVGTSFSAPLVSGIAALMLSVNGNLTPAQLASRLREGASTPFPVSSDPGVPVCHVPSGPSDVQAGECSCTTSTCGAGMANANGAIDAALRPIAAVRRYGRVLAGQGVPLDASGSAAACSHTIAAYAWTVTLPDGTSVSAGSSSSALVKAPSSGTITVTLTVTDDAGRIDTAELTIGTTSITGIAPLTAGNQPCPAPIEPTLPVTVAVSPTGPNVQAAIGVQQFAATVTSSSNNAVEWRVDGIPGGDPTVGTISSAGLYLPPEEIPSNPVVTVSAVAVADPNASGFAGATITAPVAIGIAPLRVTLAVGATQSFTAIVSNSSNNAVIWSVNGVVGGNATVGTISSTGLYTAPTKVPLQGMVSVTAVAAADPTRYALAYLTIVADASAPEAAPGRGGGGVLGLPALGGLALAAWRRLCRRRSKPTRLAPARDKLDAWARAALHDAH